MSMQTLKKQEWRGLLGCSVLVTTREHSTVIPAETAKTIGELLEKAGAKGLWVANLVEHVRGSECNPKIALTGERYNLLTKSLEVFVNPVGDKGSRYRYRVLVSDEDNERFEELAGKIQELLAATKKVRKQQVRAVLGKNQEALLELLTNIMDVEVLYASKGERFTSKETLEIITKNNECLHARNALEWLIDNDYLLVGSSRGASLQFSVTVSEKSRNLLSLRGQSVQPTQPVPEEKPQEEISSERISKAKENLKEEIREYELSAESLLQKASVLQAKIDAMEQEKKLVEDAFEVAHKKVDELNKSLEELCNMETSILHILEEH